MHIHTIHLHMLKQIREGHISQTPNRWIATHWIQTKNKGEQNYNHHHHRSQQYYFSKLQYIPNVMSLNALLNFQIFVLCFNSSGNDFHNFTPQTNMHLLFITVLHEGCFQLRSPLRNPLLFLWTWFVYWEEVTYDKLCTMLCFCFVKILTFGPF